MDLLTLKGNHEPNSISFVSGDEYKPILWITPDLKMQVAENVKVEDAARKVLDCLNHIVGYRDIQEVTTNLCIVNGKPGVTIQAADSDNKNNLEYLAELINSGKAKVVQDGHTFTVLRS